MNGLCDVFNVLVPFFLPSFFNGDCAFSSGRLFFRFCRGNWRGGFRRGRELCLFLLFLRLLPAEFFQQLLADTVVAKGFGIGVFGRRVGAVRLLTQNRGLNRGDRRGINLMRNRLRFRLNGFDFHVDRDVLKVSCFEIEQRCAGKVFERDMKPHFGTKRESPAKLRVVDSEILNWAGKIRSQ